MRFAVFAVVAFVGFTVSALVVLLHDVRAVDQRLGRIEHLTSCTWGASSIRAVRVNGRTIVSGPYTTGCVPRSAK